MLHKPSSIPRDDVCRTGVELSSVHGTSLVRFHSVYNIILNVYTQCNWNAHLSVFHAIYKNLYCNAENEQHGQISAAHERKRDNIWGVLQCKNQQLCTISCRI